MPQRMLYCNMQRSTEVNNRILAGLLFTAISTQAASADQLIYAYNDTGEHRIHIRDMETGADRIVTPAGGAAWKARSFLFE